MPNQPGQKPLNFVSSVPANGSSNVSTSLRRIKLTFDKNVVNNSVWANNRTQIKMYKGNKRITIRVTRIPDTVNFAERRNIYVLPSARLSPSSLYKVVIQPNLTAKNGEKLGKTVMITFRTRRAPIPEE